MVLNHLTFRSGYYHEKTPRDALNALVREVFGLDFSPWNQLGVIGEYTPFTLFDSDRAVANVSASPMHLTVAGRRVEAIQIGTVATRPEYRQLGLIRHLIDAAHAHFAGTCEMSFMFANETVLDFYQQFGYRPVTESTFRAPSPQYSVPVLPSRRLDLGVAADRARLIGLAERRTAVSNMVGIDGHTWLLLFHARVGYPQHIHYIEPLDVVVISVRNRHVCRLVDIIGDRIPPLAELFPYIGASEIQSVELCFSPDLMAVTAAAVNAAPQSHLFVRGPFEIEEPFRFPETAQA